MSKKMPTSLLTCGLRRKLERLQVELQGFSDILVRRNAVRRLLCERSGCDPQQLYGPLWDHAAAVAEVKGLDFPPLYDGAVTDDDNWRRLRVWLADALSKPTAEGAEAKGTRDAVEQKLLFLVANHELYTNQRDLAERVGSSPSTVRRIIHKHDVLSRWAEQKRLARVERHCA